MVKWVMVTNLEDMLIILLLAMKIQEENLSIHGLNDQFL